jgi:3-oxoacyl-[acyl-carrier-protein] synthase-3
MKPGPNVGIYAVGTYLPEAVRKNDWWPEETIQNWRAQAQARVPGTGPGQALPLAVEPNYPGGEVVLRSMGELASDIFVGTRERRVMADGMASSDMETEAARAAIEQSGIAAKDIDLVLTNSLVPDYLGSANACIVQYKLGISNHCLAMGTEGSANSFQQQLLVATEMIRGGGTKYALLIQSAASSRVLSAQHQLSITLGDAATAVVVGRVAEGYGLLGACHRTDGSLNPTAVIGPGAQAWYEAGPNTYRIADERRGRHMLLRIPDFSKEVVLGALKEAGLGPSDVAFYAVHQGAPWVLRATQSYCGLGAARSIDTYPWTASLFAANIPFQLAEGIRTSALRTGDVVAMFSGGNGFSWSGSVLRWGR